MNTQLLLCPPEGITSALPVILLAPSHTWWRGSTGLCSPLSSQNAFPALCPGFLPYSSQNIRLS